MSRPLQFRKHAIGTKPKQRGDIPFAFYRDSIALVQSEPGGGEDEESWKSFYMARKIEAFADLRDDQLRKIRLRALPPRMV